MKKLLTLFLFFLTLFYFSFYTVSFAEEPLSPRIKPPLLDVIAVRLDPKEPEQNEEFEAYFTIRNHGNVEATNVVIEFNGLSNFENLELTNRKFAHSFTPNSSNSVYFNLKALKERKGNEVSLSFSFDYEGGAGSQQIAVSLPLPEVESDTTPPNFSITNITLDPPAPGPEGFFEATITLENISNTEASEINIEADALNNFEIVDLTNRKYLPLLKKGTASTLVFKLKNKEDRKDNSIKLDFSYQYGKNKDQGEQSITVNLPLNIDGKKTRPQLKVKSFSYNEKAGDEAAPLSLTLENLGQEQAENIYVTLEGGNNLFVVQGSNLRYLPQIKGAGEATIECLLGINPEQDKNYYPLNLKIDYKDHLGNSYTSEETLGIPSTASGSTEAGTPRVLISKYTLSDEKILAGNVVTLSLFIENTHALPVYNTKVSFKVIEVEGNTGGTIFSPVNSSNSFFIEHIPGRTTLEKSIDFLVDPNAVAKTYIVPVTIEYEDGDAKPYTVEELVNIPVTQECKLQVLDLELPPVANVGQPVFVGAEFVNVGKAVLNNFMVMLEGDFHKEQASYYVGNLEIGASDYYQGIINPEDEGLLAGKLVFSYLDNNNREVRVEEPFEIEVQPMGEMEPFPDEFPRGNKPGMPDGPLSGNKRILLFVAIPAVLALAVGIYFWRRKIKKNNEEFLDA
ncbi:MAG: COG1361 S-layer family protein [Dethiobacteria bacterium]